MCVFVGEGKKKPNGFRPVFVAVPGVCVREREREKERETETSSNSNNFTFSLKFCIQTIQMYGVCTPNRKLWANQKPMKDI